MCFILLIFYAYHNENKIRSPRRRPKAELRGANVRIPLLALSALWIRCGARPYSPQAFDAAPDRPERVKNESKGTNGNIKGSAKGDFGMKRIIMISALVLQNISICGMEMPPPVKKPVAKPQAKSELIRLADKKEYEKIKDLINSGYEVSVDELKELAKDPNLWVSLGYFFLTNARVKRVKALSLKDLAMQQYLKQSKSKQVKELPADLLDVVILNREKIKLDEIKDRLNYYFQKDPGLLSAFWHEVIKKLSIAQSTQLLKDVIEKWAKLKPLKNETTAQFLDRLSRVGGMINALVEEQCILRDAIINILKQDNLLNPLINRARVQQGRSQASQAGMIGVTASLASADFPKFVKSIENRDECKQNCLEDMLKKLGKKAAELMKEMEKVKSPKKP